MKNAIDQIKLINERPVEITKEKALEKFRFTYSQSQRKLKFGMEKVSANFLGQSKVWRSLYLQAGGNYVELGKTTTQVDEYISKVTSSIQIDNKLV